MSAMATAHVALRRYLRVLKQALQHELADEIEFRSHLIREDRDTREIQMRNEPVKLLVPVVNSIVLAVDRESRDAGTRC
jgi:hypothetical protein